MKHNPHNFKAGDEVVLDNNVVCTIKEISPLGMFSIVISPYYQTVYEVMTDRLSPLEDGIKLPSLGLKGNTLQYTHEEVVNITKRVITSTIESVMNWIEKETDIVDKDTKEVFPNHEIDLKQGSAKKILDYVYDGLEKEGITVHLKENL